MRDLKADLEAIREGATLFGDPNPGVNTQYELYEVAEHAIERAIEAEERADFNYTLSVKFAKHVRQIGYENDELKILARKLVEALEIAYDAMYLDIANAHDYPNCERKVEETLKSAKEVLGDE